MRASLPHATADVPVELSPGLSEGDWHRGIANVERAAQVPILSHAEIQQLATQVFDKPARLVCLLAGRYWVTECNQLQ
jgi:hypothetical protein